MSVKISGSVGSYESGARNQSRDISTVQKLLTDAAAAQRDSSLDPRGIDGKIAKTASKSATVRAISHLQKKYVRLSRIDQRIDVGGKSWKKLITLVGSQNGKPGEENQPGVPAKPKRPALGKVTLTVIHAGRIPTKTNFAGKSRTNTTKMYESIFKVAGAVNGTFAGSIYPDDMTKKGRVVDGSYPLHIGFHKGGNKPRQGASDLVVRTSGVRAGLLVNARKAVPVESDAASKKSSQGINIHNGGNSARFSDGCLTIKPSDWSKFIKLFLDAYPDIKDWHTVGANTGKQIGTLIIKS